MRTRFSLPLLFSLGRFHLGHYYKVSYNTFVIEYIINQVMNGMMDVTTL
jgi:hypothetical protein